MEKEQSAFDPTIYLKKGDPTLVDAEQSLWQSTEVYYQTRMQTVKGIMTLKMDHLCFEALKKKRGMGNEDENASGFERNDQPANLSS